MWRTAKTQLNQNCHTTVVLFRPRITQSNAAAVIVALTFCTPTTATHKREEVSAHWTQSHYVRVRGTATKLKMAAKSKYVKNCAATTKNAKSGWSV
jgi:hypothetical protein